MRNRIGINIQFHSYTIAECAWFFSVHIKYVVMGGNIYGKAKQIV